MKYKIMVILCLIMTNITYSQYDWTEGKLVTRNGDTLSGYLKLPIINKAAVANSHKIKFRVDIKGKTTRFDHFKVDKLIFKDTDEKSSLFRYIKTSKSKYQLFKILYNSPKIRIYARMVSEITASQDFFSGFITSTGYYPSDFNEFYAQRKHEIIATPLFKVGPLSKSFSRNAVKYFSDCPDLVVKLKNRTLKKSKLLQIGKEYDECE